MASYLLHIKKPTSGDSTLMLETVTGGDPTIIFNSAAANRSGLLKFQDNGTNVGRIQYVHNGDRIDFQAGSATSATMSVANGKVGIGTTAPSFPLTVYGANQNNGSAKRMASFFDTTSATTGTGAGIALGGYTNGTGSAINDFGVIQGIKENGTAGNYASALTFHTRANGAGTLEQMRISSTGAVGIGTTTPSGGLHVVNFIRVDSSEGIAARKVRSGYFSNSQNLILSSGSSANIIMETQKVGIGTTAPASMLHIEGNTNGYNTSPLIYFGSTSTANAAVRDWAIGPADSNYGNFHIFRGASTGAAAVGTSQIAFTIASSGNVGIGNINPGAALDVTSISNAEGIRIRGRASDGISQLSITNNSGSTYAQIQTHSGEMKIKTLASIPLSFHTNNTQRMTIAGAGNVGIGTTAPTQKLEIVESSNYKGIHIRGSVAPSLSFGRSATTTQEWKVGISGVNGNNFAISTGTGSGEKLVVDTSGNVGIGTTAPQAQLQVKQLGINVNQSSVASTSQYQCDSMSATVFRSARYTVQITNVTDSTYQITEILLIHDGTTPAITEYGTIFTGTAAEATFDADINSGNVRLLATPASSDAMQFKVVRHSILV